MSEASKLRRARVAVVAVAGVVMLGAGVAAGPAVGAAPHVVEPGESLWSIAAANNLTTRTVAAFNGLSESSQVVVGQTVQVPTVDEGAAALANAGIVPGSPATAAPATAATETAPAVATPAPTAAASAPGLAPISTPYGTLYLTPAAAQSWEAMRQASVAELGIDLYPDGTLSAYRSYEQQSYLYDLYVSGQGAPANPPGSSSHEYGVAVDLAEPAMRDAVDQLGPTYGWGATIPSEWWHVAYVGG